MIEKDGVAPLEMVAKEFPSDPDILYKPKAIIECYKEIPCNPCETSCPFDAITIGEDINKRPHIDFDKCTGCAVCVYNCPGLAITVRQINDEGALLKIPYEFLPLPQKGDSVNVINREGRVIGQGVVKRVQNTMRQDHTPLIHVETRKEHIMDAMTIEVIA